MDGACSAPAASWRAFLFLACLALGTTPLLAQKGRPAAPLLELGKADPAEGRAALEQMRRLGIAGNYYLEFQLRVLPRRGEERVIAGKLWGARNQTGPLNRVSLMLPADKPGATPSERRLLIQSGRNSAVWRWDEGGAVEMLGVTRLFEPLVPNTELTAFDLQMPFLFWDNFSYQGVERFRGRPAHVLTLRPPADFAAKYPGLSAVRVHLDTQFNALVQTELLGPKGDVSKTLAVTDLKKVGEQWIVKSIDVRDEATRNKTRFFVTAVGLDLEFSRMLFEPAQLAENIRPPSAGELVRIEP